MSEAAEDALLSARGVPGSEGVGHQLGESSLGQRRSRGLAWLGLERAREAVGWLPAAIVMEDVERMPRFEDVEPVLLEVHLDPRIEDEALLDRRKQRLILLFLEFLGLWHPEVAKRFNLPSGTFRVNASGSKEKRSIVVNFSSFISLQNCSNYTSCHL